jgi:hypothetical protein
MRASIFNRRRLFLHARADFTPGFARLGRSDSKYLSILFIPERSTAASGELSLKKHSPQLSQ